MKSVLWFQTKWLIVFLALLGLVDISQAIGESPRPPAMDHYVPSNRPVDFSDDVLPILRRHCFRCHGTKNQEAGLQLNRRDDVLGENADASLVDHTNAGESLLLKRLTNESLGDLMPLDGNSLDAGEINVLRQWIEAGAPWPDELADPKHWAYEPVVRPMIPQATATEDTSECSAQPIDVFIRDRLRAAGREPSAPVSRETLIRRVSLALVGIPPTPEQVNAFVADHSSNAYENLVDRLLSSSRFGERWAVPWLDLARYADSNGFQADQIRDNWAYRDWVIGAFNNDMPYNQFVVDQLAGDLHPNATLDQKIATGFHRMTTCNVEAGVHPEANRVNQVVDRVNTTATDFLGTTLECAQCHDHKYDPFTQKDYYRLFAYFNNTPMEVEKVSGVTFEFFGPTMDLPVGEEKRQQRETLQEQLDGLNREEKRIAESADSDFESWVTKLGQQSRETFEWKPVRPASFSSTGDEDHKILEDGAVLLSGNLPDTARHTLTFNLKSLLGENSEPITAIRLDALTDDSIPGKGPGRGDEKRSNFVLHEFQCDVGSRKSWKQVSLVNAQADFSQVKWEVGAAIDGNPKTGWAIAPQFGKPHWASFELKQPLGTGLEGTPPKRVGAEGRKPSGDAPGGLRRTPNSSNDEEQLRITLEQNFGRGRILGKPRISVYHGDPELLDTESGIRELAAKHVSSDGKLSKADKKKLRKAFDDNNPKLTSIRNQITQVKKKLEQVQPDTTLVMVEMEQPRETFVMKRGDYEQLGEQVTAGPPEILSHLRPAPTTLTSSGSTSTNQQGDRMELARWITSRDNPLLPRVTVNRWWSELFGRGLVSTPEDFGTQAESPSHPYLLDWLASELMDSGWSMKHVIKQIVLSETFQQDARMSQADLEWDPDNRFYGRGPRFRMSAEMIRDNTLTIAGVLSDKMHGPPVMPYQPDDIWRSVGRNQPKWVPAQNEDRFRRGVYVICKRAAPYPSFVTFDAPLRGACVVNRPRTNTPLQALTLLNDPAYAELALAMADRVLVEAAYQAEPSGIPNSDGHDASDDERAIVYAMKLAVSRPPTESEIAILSSLLAAQREHLKEHPDEIDQRTRLPIKSMKLHSTDRAELAAWYAVANAILNLDEVMTR